MEEKKMAGDENLRIVIVGHVDHGKSTLIGRLFFDTNSLPSGRMEEVREACKELGRDMEFAYLMDSLEEERQQNVTIETTQTFFKTDKRHYVIIDAPGHVEFIKNMITGASQAEAAILMVDAGEGVAEQTKRHAYILGMLGLNKVIVVINKMDTVSFSEERFDEVKNNTIEFLSKIKISPSYVIPISAKEGDNVASKSKNMEWFKGPTILNALDTFEPGKNEDDKPLRFPIQDVYKIGDKRIMVGRLESGILNVGDSIKFLPSEKESTIKSIEVFNGTKDYAGSGEAVGITINDPHFLERGEIACAGSMPKPMKNINASIFWMSNESFKEGDKMLFRCATQEIPCTISEIKKKINSSTLETIEDNAKGLNNMEIGEAIISLDKPVITESFLDIPELGRFVLTKGFDVVAGGIIKNDKE